MLDPTLENFLEAALPQERYKLYVDIVSYLESVEYDTIESEMLDIIFTTIGDEEDQTEKSESQISDELHSHLTDILNSQLSVAGVTVDEQVTLKDRFDVLIGINHIAGYEDIGSIIATASNEDSPLDQLAEILQLVTSQPSDHWAIMLIEVSTDLIKKIREFSNKLVDHEYQEMEATAEYLQKLRLYAGYVNTLDRNLIVLDKVGEMVLGREMETYIDSGDLNSLFEGNEMEKLALEMYGYALISSDAKDQPTVAIANIAEKYLNDTARVVMLNKHVGLVNASFLKYYHSNVKTLST